MSCETDFNQIADINYLYYVREEIVATMVSGVSFELLLASSNKISVDKKHD